VIASGGPTKKNVALDAAVTRYLEAVAGGIRKRTRKEYRAIGDLSFAWARTRAIHTGDELRGEHLADLRALLVNKRRLRRARGAGRYDRVETSHVRSPPPRVHQLILAVSRRARRLPFVARRAPGVPSRCR